MSDLSRNSGWMKLSTSRNCSLMAARMSLYRTTVENSFTIRRPRFTSPQWLFASSSTNSSSKMSRFITASLAANSRSSRGSGARHGVHDDIEAEQRVAPEIEVVRQIEVSDEHGDAPEVVGLVIYADCKPRTPTTDELLR